MHPSLLDDERIRRRALAAHAATLARTLEIDSQGSRDLHVDPPRVYTPRTCREWAERLEDANREERIGG